MSELTRPPKPYGSPSRGVSGTDVERAADQLLRSGERPTVEKIRGVLGTGSPNTVNPLLNAWWKRLAARLDSGPSALHRLPESVAHVAEALWMQALEEGRRRAQLELGADRRAVDQAQDSFEVRSHVLSLREGELDSRLRDRERRYAELEAQLRALATLLQKEQKTREVQARHIAELEAELSGLRKVVTPRVRKAPPKRAQPSVAAARATKPKLGKRKAATRVSSKSGARRRKPRMRH